MNIKHKIILSIKYYFSDKLIEIYFKKWILYHHKCQEQQKIIESTNMIKAEKHYNKMLKRKSMNNWKKLYGQFQVRYHQVL